MSAQLNLEVEFLQAAAKLIQQAPLMGYQVTGGPLYREPAQAAADAAAGSGIANSLHCQRLAIDLNFYRDGVWITDGSKLADIGAWWKALGPMYFWGGDFSSRPDGNHFSLSPDNGATK